MDSAVALLSGSPPTLLIDGLGTRVSSLEMALGILARSAGPDRVFVHASALADLGLPEELGRDAHPGELALNGAPGTHWPVEAWVLSPSGLGPYAVATYRTGGRRIEVAVPAWHRGNPLADLEPRTLALTLATYEEALGADYAWSPGSTGTRLMDGVHAHGRRVGPSCFSGPLALMSDPALESDMRWSRPLMRQERARPYVVGLDQASRYLASCSSVLLGYGEPEHLERPSKFDARAPGYWAIGELAAPAPLLGPDPFNASREWVTTPTLELAYRLGMEPKISEAYVWRDHGTYLRPWYARLSAARNEVTALALTHPGGFLTPERIRAGEAARELVKRTYTDAIGSLAGHWREPGDRYHRPDWRHQIIALSRANTYRAILRLAHQHDPALWPFMVEVDAAYYAVDEAAAQEMLAGLAGWRYLGAGLTANLPGEPTIKDVRAAIKAGVDA